jgi:glyoxylase-like metal-dependent hydrolase (beta-lactamase superfamily II)
MLATNCYIIGSEQAGEGMVIDPGGGAKQIMQAIGDLKLDIKFIVLTHGHIDHLDALAEVKVATGAEFCAHADDTRFIQERPLHSKLGVDYPELPIPDKWLNDEESINVGDLQFLVLHTPGHSPGGICLLGQGVVFTGDTLFNNGIGRTDLFGGSYGQLMNGIHTKLMVLPDETIVYPGHGPDTTIGAERRVNPFLRISF